MHINLNPTPRQLRQFSMTGCAIALVLVWFSGFGLQPLISLHITLFVIAFATWQVPQLARYPFLLATLITAPIGWIVGELALLVIYFGVFTPLGFLRKFFSPESVAPSFRTHSDAETYWIDCPPPRDTKSYLKRY